MSEKVAYFNIHDLLKIAIKTYEKKFHRVINRVKLEYELFACEEFNKSDDVDINVFIGRIAKNRLINFVKIDNKFLVSNDWIYLEDSYKIAKWKILIEGINSDKINIIIEPNFFASDLIPPLILTPLIFLQLLKKEYLLAHAAGISDGHNAVLLTGFGGAGKTLTTLRALSSGMKFLGDDHVILHKGEVLSFPTAISLFKYNIPQKAEWLKPWRFELALKSFINKFTFGYIYPVTKASIRRAFPDLVVKNSFVKVVVLLERSNNHEMTVEQIDADELAEAWLRNILLDILYLYKYLCAYSYVNPEFSISEYLEKIKNLIMENLLKCKSLIKVKVSSKDNSTNIINLINDLLQGGNNDKIF